MDRDRFPAPFGRTVIELASVCLHLLKLLFLETSSENEIYYSTSILEHVLNKH